MNTIISLFIFVSIAITNPAFAENIKVTKLAGQITYDQKALFKDQDITPGGIIEVSKGEKDFVELSYPTGHKLRLKKGAKLRIEAENPKEPKLLNLLYGQLYVYFHKKKNEEEPNLNIKTKTAVVGVRGTKFLVQEEDGGTYYCVCDGVIEVTRENITRQVKKDQDLWSRPNKPLGEPKTSPDMGKQTEGEFKAMGL